MADEEEPNSKESAEEDNPWATLFWGAILIAAGVGLYFYFGHLEQEGGSVRMNAIILAIYKVAGKTGILVILGGLGGLMTAMGIKELMNRGKAE